MIRVRQEADKDRGNLERKKEPEWGKKGKQELTMGERERKKKRDD